MMGPLTFEPLGDHERDCHLTGRTEERLTQSKRARASSLAIVDQPQVA